MIFIDLIMINDEVFLITSKPWRGVDINVGDGVGVGVGADADVDVVDLEAAIKKLSEKLFFVDFWASSFSCSSEMTERKKNLIELFFLVGIVTP